MTASTLEGIGFVNIIDLIDNSDSDAELFSQSSFTLKLLTNPTGTGFPMILGEAWPNTVNRTMFLLTPVAVPQ